MTESSQPQVGAEWHLAQLNIARIRFDLDDERMAGFVDNLDRINQLGEDSPGFVWRHQTEEGDATAERIFDLDDVLLNLTVWESAESLRDFTYKTDHVEFLRRRGEWFVPYDDYPVTVGWWIPAGTLPTLDEARERIEMLRRDGPSSRAFPLNRPQPPPDQPPS